MSNEASPTEFDPASVPDKGAYVIGILNEDGEFEMLSMIEHKRLGDKDESK